MCYPTPLCVKAWWRKKKISHSSLAPVRQMCYPTPLCVKAWWRKKNNLALVTGPGAANVLPHTPECHGLMADKLFLIAFFGCWWWVWQELLFARFLVRSCLVSPNLLRLFVWPCVFPPGFVFARVFVRLGVCSPVCFRPLFCSPGSGSPHFLFVTGLRLGEEQIKMEIRAGKLELSFDFPAPHI